MKKTMALVPVSLLIFMLAGCTTTVTKKAVQGEHKEVAAIADSSGGLEQLSIQDHLRVCESLVKLREFKSFFSCHDSLSNRVAADGGYMEFEYAGAITFRRTFFNKPHSKFILESMLSEAYLALGQYDDVIKHAGIAIELTENSIFQTRGEDEQGAGLKALSSLVTLGQDSEMKKDITRANAIGPMGQIALAYVAKGNHEMANKFARRLEAIYTGGLATRSSDVIRRAAVARIYFAQQDYATALKAMKAESELGLGGVFFETLTAVNYVNPANYIMVPLYYGTMSLQDIQYIQEFEPKFMLYRCQLETGDLVNAKKGYDDALAEPRLSGFGEMYYLVLYDRGRIALLEGDTDTAIGYFKRAIEVIESQRSSITLERFKIGFAGNKQEVYSVMVKTLVSNGQPGQALEYAERGKARALVDLLAYRKNFNSTKQPERTRELLQELDELERLSLAKKTNTRGASTRSVSGTRQAIKTINPELASLVTVSTLSSKQIQEKLQPDEVLLEYFYEGDSDLYAFVVTSEGIDVFTLSAKGLKQDVGRFRDAISAYPDDSWEIGAEELYQRLITPLYSAINNKKHLTIVPHGVLHYLPFNALRNEQFLIEKYTVRLLPSASTLQFLHKKTHPTSNLLVLGNPDLNNSNMDLPGAEKEARSIARSWSDSKVILRKNASETVFKKSSGAFRYIHLASHGEFNSDRPQESRMLLSADARNDGNLTISEIYDLRLNADMVTLSACQTGLGDVKNGDDVVGLNRGFLYAGAKSIVASLWSVPDESTRVLMTTFYTRLKSQDKRSSMQQAQIKGIEKYKHPIAWAAFQMTGGI